MEHAPGQSGVRLAKRLGEICVITLICASFTVPPIPSPIALLWLKFEQILLPLVLIVYAWMLLAGVARSFRFNELFGVAGVYLICILFSMWYGATVLHEQIITRDFYEYIKVWLPAVFFTLAYEAELSEGALRRLFKFYGVSILLVCLYSWAQWLGLSFTYYVNQFYSAGVHEDVLFSERRVYGTMGNPNVLGILMTWTMAAFLLAVLFNVGNRRWNAAIALSCLVTLAMTGSRYGAIDAGVVFVLIMFLPSYVRRRHPPRWGVNLALGMVFVLAFGIVAVSNPATLERYRTLQNPGQVDSFQGRLATSWHNAVTDLRQSPLVGRGPAKLTYAGVFTDSEYLEVLRKYGIAGFCFYILYFLFPLRRLLKGFQAARRAGPFLEENMPATLLTLRVSTVMVATALVMNVGMGTLYDAMIEGLLFLWLGLGARCATTIGEVSRSIGENPEPIAQGFFPGAPGASTPTTS